MAELLLKNSLRPKLFVEPFAGGAAVALQLLNNRLVDSIALGERDPLVACFWKIVFKDPEWLIEQISKIPVSLRKWKFFRSNTFQTDRERALACLFLNRTSFSGILASTAGPIGGQQQESPYTIDCRFPVKTLAKRIRQAAALGERVSFVQRADWAETIARVESLGHKRRDVFYYLDPPFYRKAERLYRFCFIESDHKRLYDVLMKLKAPWLLSYDPAKPIMEMYSDNGSSPRSIELLYSVATGSSLVRAQELIITNLPKLPDKTRLWSTDEERRNARRFSATTLGLAIGGMTRGDKYVSG